MADIQSVISMAQEAGVEFVDLKFVGLLGDMQHLTYPAKVALTEGWFKNGAAFDGSSVRGFQTIDKSDMLLMPDPSTAVVDPVCDTPTLTLFAHILDPRTMEPYSRDPRYIVQKAVEYMKSTGIADTAYFGPEAEFFLFNGVSYGGHRAAGGIDGHYSHYKVESVEGDWHNGHPVSDPDTGEWNSGRRPRNKGGYVPVAPVDSLVEVRNDICRHLEAAGIEVDLHHHEVASGGQCEIGITFCEFTEMCDKLMMHKYIVKNVAHKHGLTATFMPKPIFGDNGTGMHCHQSVWKDGDTLMHDPNTYAELSDIARWYIGGLLKHAPALLAFTNPSTNSYHRLVPGYEAPIYLLYSQSNRSAAVRIPLTKAPKAKRIEFRTPDVTGNIYLSLTAQLMAGLDGILNKIEPGEPFDKDLYELEPEEKHGIPTVPGSLDEVLNALEADHEFLTVGGVFTKDLIDMYIDLKRGDVDALRLRPHPYEFSLYFDV
ncbi:MAG TPA: type I glutamate--ammonia ligase [Abditibacterium sp.]